MDFSIPPDFLLLKSEVLSFAANEISTTVKSRDEHQEFPRSLWQKCADFGILGLASTSNFGGKYEEVKLLRALFAMEALGYGSRDAGLLLGLNAQMWTVQIPILEFGNEDQKAKFLLPSVQGKLIGCHALTEPGSGSDAYQLQTTATKTENGYILNGKKHLVTLAPAADYSLVFAQTNPKLGKWGISAFLVESGSNGFVQSEEQSKMGLRTVPIGELTFNNCFVPEENRLGSEGAGFSICNHSLEYDRCCMLAGNLGIMEHQLERSIDVVKNTLRFGQSVGKFQSVSNRIADMKLRLETSRLLLYKVAWLKETGQNALMESAMLKLQLGESFVESSISAIRNHGGLGYLTEHETERDLRDAIGGVLYAGTSDIQRSIIAKLLGL